MYYDVDQESAKISIHAPREGGDGHACALEVTVRISIHAPREGGDIRTDLDGVLHIISIHAPREGGDNTSHPYRRFAYSFQSTPPARGATILARSQMRDNLFQSTPPARGATAV